ncbi:2-C-methyl-D-erythritol 4-phosphate cytidylyltransferase [Gulosibacter chungangensis]|uniref:Bifunctional enzyme IspD/IspF n=1 Tax=Gulosibacter chungangensis TaxID=979746 RepID=A0A7J5BAL9_9MICO|nr:2-C-methyl-D-erythritol 4-phosphate cytidylyltransferase [Gulosibacter chungangensis]KAB1643096.1 2-C-methyl-D-erythritol 2,4-cyclodiphosphate synthase [Gulosibacter chungangensis]
MSELSPCTGIVIVAAGSGTRLGLGTPKAFVTLAGEPILAHALRSLTGLPGRVAVTIAVPPGDASSRAMAEELAQHELVPLGEKLAATAIVDGGDSRHESVRASLAALPEHCDIVLVHDAARALASPDFFARIAGAVRATRHGIVPGLPVIDTIKQVDATGRVVNTVDREFLRVVQTPQGFPFSQLLAAYRAGEGETTDDAATFAAAGGTVEIVPGEASAFKITGPEDLRQAEELLARQRGNVASGPVTPGPVAPGPAPSPGELRVGVGTDAHAFDVSAPCWLAGIHFPNERGLSGHSDGDAASHAMVDALLGAAGLGSIGSVFGTSDPQFQGVHGTVFLEATRELLATKGCRIQNVSLQVVCHRPRFAERVGEAETVLSASIGAPVTVSATTSDGLGFSGRNEGVFAIATALVAVPASTSTAARP